MEDFRAQLGEVIEHMTEAGARPLFLVCDLDGIADMKKTHGAESVTKFHQAAIAALVNAANGADAFTYGEARIVAILDGREYDRLRTFALIQKLRRVIPMLGQSFDAFLQPEFDAIEYDAQTGLGGVIAALARPRRTLDAAA